MDLRCFVSTNLTFIKSSAIVADLIYTLHFIATKLMNSVVLAQTKPYVVRDPAELIFHFQFTFNSVIHYLIFG
jgi:hypothetical protein